VAEAQRYAAWKAADIRKALREGRRPLPGPPATWDKKDGDGGEAGTSSGGLPDLPPPPAGPAGLDRSDSVLGGGDTGGDTSLTPGPPRFAVGDAIFYCPDGHGPPARGRVSDGPFPPEGLGHTYAIAVSAGGGGGGESGGGDGGAALAQAVRAFERQLAPDLPPGTAVTVGPAEPGPDGVPPPRDAPPPGAGVVEGLADPAAWRPLYKIKLDGAKKGVVVPDTRLAGWTRGGGDAGPAPLPPAQPSAPLPPFAAPHPPPEPSAPASTSASTPYVPPLAAVTEAQKAAKMAASACGFEDIPTAVRYLQDALRLLTVEGAAPGGGGGGGKGKK
jgi:vacuolar protein sorting-associated protein VTA1